MDELLFQEDFEEEVKQEKELNNNNDNDNDTPQEELEENDKVEVEEKVDDPSLSNNTLEEGEEQINENGLNYQKPEDEYDNIDDSENVQNTTEEILIYSKNDDDGKVLTHEEIWDDSMLIKAWDNAVKKYEKYHSIKAI